MELNIIFRNVKIYNVQSQLDVAAGQIFKLEVIGADPIPEIFTNNDPVLAVEGFVVVARKPGTSLVRFMTATTVVKDLIVNVWDQEPVTDLGGKLGEPVPKAEPKK